MVKKKTAKKKPTVKRRVRQLERRVHQMDVEAQEAEDEAFRFGFRVRRDVAFLGEEVRRHDGILEDQSKRIESLEDRAWMNENPF